MVGLLSIIALGFFLGMRHATDPDHVIAVTTIVARNRGRRQAAVIGAVWGIGHTLTILVVGGGILLLHWVIPARTGLSMELSVGIMLILLGGWNLTAMAHYFSRARSLTLPEEASLHRHPHVHDDYIHAQTHSHSPETHSHILEGTSLGAIDRIFGSIGIYQVLRPLLVGIVHGLAGSAAVALLVLATIQNVRWAIFYLLLFGFGTVAGMMLITVAIALPFTASKSSIGLERGLRIASGLISLVFGLFVIYQIGFVGGLFSGNPHWTPR